MANNYNPNNYNAYGNYNPYNSVNYYSQKMQNLQGIREQVDKQMQDIQNMQNMQQHFMNQQPQPQINQTFQLSNPNNNNDFDAKYIENSDDVKNIIVYKNSLFINRDMNRLCFKDANGNVRFFELNEIIEKDPKDIEIEKQSTEINDLKEQIQKLTFLVAQQNNIPQNNIEQNNNIEPVENNNVIGKIEPVKKVVEKNKSRRG